MAQTPDRSTPVASGLAPACAGDIPGRIVGRGWAFLSGVWLGE